MADNAVGVGARYWAFVSYSHKDSAFGRRLHRRLESYALPRRLVGRETTQGVVPKRLAPVFRDREEFSAASDLSAEVRAALGASRSLVVVCSSAAAASQWVTREIELFRTLHPDRPIFAALREGEPRDSIPDALRRSGPDGTAIEPLAADFRRGGDGEQLAFLKLVAGIVSIGLDELVQRDAARRLRRVMAVTAAALVAVLAMGALTILALSNRAEAERQRGQAEGLVRFMYTDLRDELRGVGRLDLMAAVNARALKYCDDESADVRPASRAQCARIFDAIGEDDETRGRLDPARWWFRRAWNTTSELLAAAPNDPDRIFDHAQSEYWIGFDDYSRGHLVDARHHFLTYKSLAERLVATGTRNGWYTRELAFSEGDICTVDLRPSAKNNEEALKECTLAVEHMSAAARLIPSDLVDADLANEYAGLADSYRAIRNNQKSIETRLIEKKILDRLIQSDPLNMQLRSLWVTLQRPLARMEALSGRVDDASARLTQTQQVLDLMVAFDPTNKSWATQRQKVAAELANLRRDQPTNIEKGKRQ
jgi:hypothetical protein